MEMDATQAKTLWNLVRPGRPWGLGFVGRRGQRSGIWIFNLDPVGKLDLCYSAWTKSWFIQDRKCSSSTTIRPEVAKMLLVGWVETGLMELGYTVDLDHPGSWTLRCVNDTLEHGHTVAEVLGRRSFQCKTRLEALLLGLMYAERRTMRGEGVPISHPEEN